MKIVAELLEENYTTFRSHKVYFPFPIKVLKAICSLWIFKDSRRFPLSCTLYISDEMIYLEYNRV